MVVVVMMPTFLRGDFGMPCPSIDRVNNDPPPPSQHYPKKGTSNILIHELKIWFAGAAAAAVDRKGRLIVAVSLQILHGSCDTFDISGTVPGLWTEGALLHLPLQLMLFFHGSSLRFPTLQSFVMLQ